MWIGIGLGLGVGAVVAIAGCNRPAAGPQQAFSHPIEAVGAEWLRPAGAEAAYAGSEACRSCHAAEFAAYATTPHSRSVRRIAPGEARPEFRQPARVRDEMNGIEYAIEPTGKSGVMVARGDQGVQKAGATWAFGSGTHAFTYLHQQGERYTELRLSYYPRARQWNFTPGQGPANPQGTLLGQEYSPLGAAACFGCHSTVLVGSTQGLDFGKSLLRVGCESCHGPSKAHVESAQSGAAAAVQPSLPRGKAQLEACGACHRVPTAGPVNPMMESQLARFAGPALMRSRCYLESEGKLTCTTCHDPHRPAVKSVAFYDAKCGRCHQPETGKGCTALQEAKCVSCHMPKQKVARRLPMVFHNHWIRRELPPEEQMMRELAAAWPRGASGATAVP